MVRPNSISFTLAAVIMALVTNNAVYCATAAARSAMKGRKVVLMSMDGFRYDYLTRGNLTNFKALIASGVKVPYVNNTFATQTFPCHYTIVTGRYEESHGIVSNKMYDPEFDDNFQLSNVETRWWDGAEPVWINAVKAGLKTGVYFWPGSEAELQGLHPTRYRKYDGNIPFEERVDTLVDDWLSRDDFDLGLIYFNEPDHSGHVYGPDAPEMLPILGKMDKLLGYFINKLEENNLKDKVDFIITSDHGMTNVNQTHRLIALDDYLNSTLLKQMVGGGAFAHLRPQPGKAQDIVDALTGVPHLTVYHKENIPERWHYKDHRRIMPVLAVADEGWVIRKKYKKYYTYKGNHGYNDVLSMNPIFVASGPSFKQGVEVDPIKSVDIYPLLCHLLGVDPAPNNGSFDRVKQLLQDRQPDTASSLAAPLQLIIILSALIKVLGSL